MFNVLEYLNQKGWKTKQCGDQLMVEICPLCFKDHYHFYINKETGAWDCKVCGEHGGFYDLKAKLGDLTEFTKVQKVMSKKEKSLDIAMNDLFIENLSKDQNAKQYLLSRGFSEDTIRFFKLGVEGDWITIPHFQGQQLWNIKKRNYIDKDFRRITGQPTVLFNSDNVDPEKKSLLLTECETDCIAAHQMGAKNVVGLTAGAGSFLPEWIPFFQKFQNIYICLDNDDAGRKGAYKIAEKIGFSKCRNVKLPENIKDINDLLKEEKGKEIFEECVKNASHFSMNEISSISGYVNELDQWLSSDGSVSGIELPFERTNKILNGFKAEDLIILSGSSGLGKTTMLLNFLNHFLKKGKKCLGFFLEGKIMYYITRMMSMQCKKPLEDLRTNSEEWEKLKNDFSDYPMFFYSGAQAEIDTEKLKQLITAAVKLYDIDFVVIDNLQKFVRPDAQVVNKTSNAVSVLKDLAVDLKVPILLIAHVTKPDKEQKRVTMFDAKFSSTIYQDADVYLVIWDNKKNETSDPDLMLTIEKNRMGEGGVDIKMTFEKEYATWLERIPELDHKKKEKVQKAPPRKDIFGVEDDD